MSKNREVRELIAKIAKTGQQTSSLFTVEVLSIEGDTCTVVLGDLEVTGVKLGAIVGGTAKGVLITPTIGSMVSLIDFSSGELRDLQVVGYSEVDSITLLGGDNAGIIKIHELTSKINELVNSVNLLVEQFNTHTHQVATTGTAAAQSGTAAPVTGTVEKAVELQASDYEDAKITH